MAASRRRSSSSRSRAAAAARSASSAASCSADGPAGPVEHELARPTKTSAATARRSPHIADSTRRRKFRSRKKRKRRAPLRASGVPTGARPICEIARNSGVAMSFINPSPGRCRPSRCPGAEAEIPLRSTRRREAPDIPPEGPEGPVDPSGRAIREPPPAGGPRPGHRPPEGSLRSGLNPGAFARPRITPASESLNKQKSNPGNSCVRNPKYSPISAHVIHAIIPCGPRH